ncbi:MAG: hypothetical protein RMK74_03380 [Myxococcales bacterium]|nr:hypothetical protein [Myxococcales bacterium]
MRYVLEGASSRLAVGVAVLLGALLARSGPLLGAPGVESALVMGVVLPPFVAAAAAARVVRVRRRGLNRSVGRLMREASGTALLTVVAATASLGIVPSNAPWCDPFEGLGYVAMGPGVGAVLAAWAGVATGLVLRRRALAVGLAALVPVASAVASVAGIWATPAVFAYDVFAGWFPGPLLDRALDWPAPYLPFRLLCVVGTAGILCLVAAFAPRSCIWTGHSSRRPMLAVAGLVLTGAALLGEWHGARLGHRSHRAGIVERLGATAHGRRCTVHAPRELRGDDIARLVEDCDFRVEQMESRLGVAGTGRIVAFVFRDADEKRAAMGAGPTHVAKPWRREVYLQLAPWPHPLLAHEVAHVVAARVARGPFGVSGTLGGWIPAPGLIEGLAVALAWDEHDGLSPHQWAAALLALGRVPPVERLFGVGFLAQPPRDAYTLSGSFVRWLLDRRGPAAVRALYREADPWRALGESWSALERDWQAFLARIELPPGALDRARDRFAQRALFSTRCPRTIARLEELLAEDLAVDDVDRASQRCERLLTIEPQHGAARVQRVALLARRGRVDLAQTELARLEREGLPAASLAHALAAIGDAHARRGRLEQAAGRYRRILELPVGAEPLRQAELRLASLRVAPDVRAELLDVLQRPGDATPARLLDLAARWRAADGTGIGDYLEARQLEVAGSMRRAADGYSRALERGLPGRELMREAERRRATCLTAAGALDEASRIWSRIAEEAPEEGTATARDFLERIGWLRTHRATGVLSSPDA